MPNYTAGGTVPSLPQPKTAAKWVVAWVVSNLVWTLVSGAAGALVSALLKGLGVLDNTYALVGVGLLVAAALASLPGAVKRVRGTDRRLRVATAPGSPHVPLVTAPELRVSEEEAQRIAASTDPHFAQYRSMPKAKMTPLERWLEGRVEEHAVIARERAVRGDLAYLNRMGEWDTQNVNELAGIDPHSLKVDTSTAVAPELADSYRADPRNPQQVDGIEPPHTVEIQDAYFERRLDWLKGTLRRLRENDEHATDTRDAHTTKAPILQHDAVKQAASEPLSLSERLVAFYREGEQLRARILWSGTAIPRDLVHGTASQRQIERERLAREWDGRILAVLPDDARPKWIAAATLPEHTLDPASTIAGVREFLAKKLVCLKEIIRQLDAAAPQSGELSDAAQPEPSAAASEWSPPPPPPESPGAPLLRAMSQHPEQRKQRKHSIQRGNDLLGLIFQAELQNGPGKTSEIVYHNLAARVEAWGRGIGSTEEVQRFSGDPGADLARLKLLVQMEVARLRALQEQV